jgi:uncharacterized protein (TIGR00725 family)
VLTIVVIGKGQRCPPDLRILASQVGTALARLHPAAVLVTGGMEGVMDAAARSFTREGGVAIGLLPLLGGKERQPSAHHTYLIRTGLPLNLRNVVTANAADVGVVLPGSVGTVVEGWVMSDRGVILLGVGDHSGWPSGGLPFTTHAGAPGELPGMIAGYLGIPPEALGPGAVA